MSTESDDITPEDAYRAVSVATTRDNLALRAELDALKGRLAKAQEAWSRVRTCCAFVGAETAVLHDCCNKHYGACAADLERVIE